MTSFQPGEQSYTAPQDPWSGSQGVASPPTDPIPAPPRGQFRPGVAAPSAPPPGIWSQETVVHDPYGDGREPRRSRAGLYILVALLVLVLGPAGAYGAWWVITERIVTTTAPSSSAEPSGTVTESGFVMRQARAEQIRVGDCLVNRGTDADPDMWFAPCEAPDAYRILSVAQGEAIPENAEGRFDEHTTAPAVCSGVVGWDGPYFGWNNPRDDSQDYFFCMQLVQL